MKCKELLHINSLINEPLFAPSREINCGIESIQLYAYNNCVKAINVAMKENGAVPSLGITMHC